MLDAKTCYWEILIGRIEVGHILFLEKKIPFLKWDIS